MAFKPISVGFREWSNYPNSAETAISIIDNSTLKMVKGSVKGTGMLLFTLKKRDVISNNLYIKFGAKVNLFTSGDGVGLSRYVYDGFYNYKSYTTFPNRKSMVPKGSTIFGGTTSVDNFTTKKEYMVDLKTCSLYTDNVITNSYGYETWDGIKKTFEDFSSNIITVEISFNGNGIIAREFTFDNIQFINGVTNEVLWTLNCNTYVSEERDTSNDYGRFSVGELIEVWNAEDLYNVRYNISGNYIQMADIDLSSYPNWEPIQESESVSTSGLFIGKYNGNFKKITNLTNTSVKSYIGLFYNIINATIEKVKLYNVNIQAQSSAGGICATSYNSTISECYVEGRITTVQAGAGGIASSVENNSNVNKCEVNVELSGAEYVGGISGTLLISNINECVSHGSVNISIEGPGNKTSGGICGLTNGAASNQTSTISNCYSFVSVLSTVGNAGGLVGLVGGYTNVINCYRVGTLSSFASVFINNVYATSSVQNCFHDWESSGKNITLYATAKATSEMKQQSTFIDWDFENVWEIKEYENNGYPKLQWQPDESQPSEWIEVWTPEDLYNVRNNLSAKYIQMADIDLSVYPNWEPIAVAVGRYWENMPHNEKFTGIYDGNDFKIKNMYIETSEDKTCGLFGCATGNVVIKNITMENPQIIVGNGKPVGCILAVHDGGIDKGYVTIINCKVLDGVIKVQASNGDGIGGIVGQTLLVNISDCLFNGIIRIETSNSVDPVGGIAGYIMDYYYQTNMSSIKNCVSSLNLILSANSDTSNVGGIVGYAGSTNIELCNSSVNVSCGNEIYCYIGGVIGSYDGNETYISNSQSNLTINGSGGTLYWGGIAQYASNVSIESCYSNINIVSTFDCYGGGGIINYCTDVNVNECYSDIDATFSYCSDIGGIIGYANTRNINNTINLSHSNIKIDAYNVQDIGGIVGYLFNSETNIYSSINSCYSISKISSQNDGECIGGLVGYSRSGTINSSYGDIKCIINNNAYDIAGLVGVGINTDINNCYAKGDIVVENGNKIAGLIGSYLPLSITNVYGSIINCYSICKQTVNNVKNNLGSLIGYCVADKSSIITSSYFNSDIIPVLNDFGTPMQTSLMKDYINYIGWNFDTIWNIKGIENDGYPRLQWQPNEWIEIWTAEDLYNVRNKLDGKYIQMANISLLAYPSWEPIAWANNQDGNYVDEVNKFNGIYDGNNFSINNLKIDKYGASGLFGCVSGNVIIKNVTINSPILTINLPFTSAGFIFGVYNNSVDYTASPTIFNCKILNATIDAKVHNVNNIGGIIGKTSNIKIDNCTFKGVFNFTNRDKYQIGGIAGYILCSNEDSYIKRCTIDATFNMSGEYFLGIGGISGIIRNCPIIDECNIVVKVTITDYMELKIGGIGEDISGSSFRGLISNSRGDLKITNTANSNNRNTYTGAIANQVSDIDIIGCVGNVDIITPGVCIDTGGIVGTLNHSNISKSYGSCKITAYKTYQSGGLVGRTSAPGLTGKTNIDMSYGNINVSTTKDSKAIGGLVGSTTYQSYIDNCYSKCVTSAEYGSQVGGLIGLFNVVRATNILNCYALLNLSQGFSNIGGLIGHVSNLSPNVSNSYYDKEISNQTDTGKGEPKTTIEMKQQYTFVDWDFDTIWELDEIENNGYPRLQLQPKEWVKIYSTNDFINIGIGGQNKYIQMNDLDFKDITLSKITYIEGTYNGNGYCFSNASFVDTKSYSNIGIFDLYGGILENVNFKNISITTRDNSYQCGIICKTTPGNGRRPLVRNCTIDGFTLTNPLCYWSGSLIGQIREATDVINCHAKNVNINSTHSNGGIGGLVGYILGLYKETNDYKTTDTNIIECSVKDSSIKAEKIAAGMVGIFGRLNMERCLVKNTTITTTGQYAAGMLGQRESKCNTIRDCYCIANVKAGSNYAAGFAADTHVSSDIYTTFTNCYSASLVSSSAVTFADDGTMGGLLSNGRYENPEYYTNCYYDLNLLNTESIKQIENLGEVYGHPKTTVEMKQQSTFVGWDFDNVWFVGYNYPELRWNLLKEPPVDPEEPIVNNALILPINTISATQKRSGVIKIGSGINVTNDGTISVNTVGPGSIAVKDNVINTSIGLNTKIINFNTEISGNYLIFIYFSIEKENTKVTVSVNYTDRRGPQTQIVIDGEKNGITPVGSYSIAPMFISSLANNEISVVFNSSELDSIFASASICTL